MVTMLVTLGVILAKTGTFGETSFTHPQMFATWRSEWWTSDALIRILIRTDHLCILATGETHATLSHAVRAGQVQLQGVWARGQLSRRLLKLRSKIVKVQKARSTLQKKRRHELRNAQRILFVSGVNCFIWKIFYEGHNSNGQFHMMIHKQFPS